MQNPAAPAVPAAFLQDVPKCRVCGVTAPAPWCKLDAVQRAAWTHDKNTVCCRKCLLAAKIERHKFKKVSVFSRAKCCAPGLPSCAASGCRLAVALQTVSGSDSITAGVVGDALSWASHACAPSAPAVHAPTAAASHSLCAPQEREAYKEAKEQMCEWHFQNRGTSQARSSNLASTGCAAGAGPAALAPVRLPTAASARPPCCCRRPPALLAGPAAAAPRAIRGGVEGHTQLQAELAVSGQLRCSCVPQGTGVCRRAQVCASHTPPAQRRHARPSARMRAHQPTPDPRRLWCRLCCRPSEALRSLMQSIFEDQREDPTLHVGIQRKPCGFVPSTAEYLCRASPAQRAQLHAAATAMVAAELARCSAGSMASSAAGEQRRDYLLDCQAKLSVLVEGHDCGEAAGERELQLRHADSAWSAGACCHGRCSLSRRAGAAGGVWLGERFSIGARASQGLASLGLGGLKQCWLLKAAAACCCSRLRLPCPTLAAASVAAQAVAEVALEAAQREAAAAAEREAAEAAAAVAAEAGPAPLTPIAEDESDGDTASWQRRRVLWQLHHQKSTVFTPDGCSPEALSDLLAGDSEDEGSCSSIPAALGDSASSLERRRPARKLAVHDTEIEVATLQAHHASATAAC